MGDITKLKVWKSSLDLASQVYTLSQEGPLAKDFSFRDQIRRAAVSVPSNIAEGASSGFDRLGIRYFYNARASCSELKTQLIIAQRINYINQSKFDQLIASIDSILKMLNSFINYRKVVYKKIKPEKRL